MEERTELAEQQIVGSNAERARLTERLTTSEQQTASFFTAKRELSTRLQRAEPQSTAAQNRTDAIQTKMESFIRHHNDFIRGTQVELEASRDRVARAAEEFASMLAEYRNRNATA
jgi:hypothetical protein